MTRKAISYFNLILKPFREARRNINALAAQARREYPAMMTNHRTARSS